MQFSKSLDPDDDCDLFLPVVYVVSSLEDELQGSAHGCLLFQKPCDRVQEGC